MQVIMVRLNGIIPMEMEEKYRKKLIEEMKEGLFVVDDSVKEVIVSNISELGLEFNEKENEINEKENA